MPGYVLYKTLGCQPTRMLQKNSISKQSIGLFAAHSLLLKSRNLADTPCVKRPFSLAWVKYMHSLVLQVENKSDHELWLQHL